MFAKSNINQLNIFTLINLKIISRKTPECVGDDNQDITLEIDCITDIIIYDIYIYGTIYNSVYW